LSALVKLLFSPFCWWKLSRKPELPAKMIDAGLNQPTRSPA